MEVEGAAGAAAAAAEALGFFSEGGLNWRREAERARGASRATVTTEQNQSRGCFVEGKGGGVTLLYDSHDSRLIFFF